MQKTPFKNINWFSFYDQMNIDFWFFCQFCQNERKNISQKTENFTFLDEHWLFCNQRKSK